MASIPALVGTYFTRANIPDGGNNTTEQLLTQWRIWTLKACLMDQVSTGSTGGSRDPASIWTCVGSSDGVTAASDGVDRWGSSFDPSKLVRGQYSDPRSWIVLYNANMEMQMLISIDGSGWGRSCLTIGFARTGSGFSAGFDSTPATTATPTTTTPSLNTEYFSWRPDFDATWSFSQDRQTGVTHYAHFTCDDQGFFHYSHSRANLTVFSGFFAFWNVTGGATADSRKRLLLHSTGTGDNPDAPIDGRGAPRTENTWISRRMPNDAAGAYPGYSETRWSASLYHGYRIGDRYAVTYGRDAITGGFQAYPIHILPMSSFSDGGFLRDMYFTSRGAPVGSVYPATGTFNRILAGDVLVPWNNVLPII